MAGINPRQSAVAESVIGAITRYDTSGQRRPGRNSMLTDSSVTTPFVAAGWSAPKDRRRASRESQSEGDGTARERRCGRLARPRVAAILRGGQVSEWLKVPLSKSGVVMSHRGFESHLARHGARTAIRSDNRHGEGSHSWPSALAWKAGTGKPVEGSNPSPSARSSSTPGQSPGVSAFQRVGLETFPCFRDDVRAGNGGLRARHRAGQATGRDTPA